MLGNVDFVLCYQRKPAGIGFGAFVVGLRFVRIVTSEQKYFASILAACLNMYVIVEAQVTVMLSQRTEINNRKEMIS